MRKYVCPPWLLGMSVTIFSAIFGVAAWAQSNPVPLINQPVVPTIAALGGPTFTLTVNGTGFVSSSAVQWNGAPLTTQFVSSSQLAASVPASNIAAVSTAAVTVSSPGPGGGVSNSEFLCITTARPAIALTYFSSVEAAGPVPVSVADFSGDGKLDLAMPTGESAVAVALGNGDGTFQPPVTFATGNGPYVVAAADLNHDGNVDLTITNEIDGSVSVLVGNGDGTFQPHVDYAVGNAPEGLALGDFNGDGNLDLAVSNAFDGTVSVLLGNGDGTFQPQLVSQASCGGPALAVGDFEGEGKLDLAVASAGTGNCGVAIMIGNGDGTFQRYGTVGQGGSTAVVTADFNGDGKLDLAYGTASVWVALGNGDGTFSAPVTYPTGGSPNSITVADFNGDGKLDLATASANSTPPFVSTLLGEGNGTFRDPLDQEQVSYGMAAADFNGDGLLDLVTTGSGGAAVLLGSNAEFSSYILNFGTVEVGSTSPPQPVTLTNGANSPLTISSISAAAPFAQTNNCGNNLAAGASCTISVVFAPTGEGTEGGSLTVNDSAVGGSQVVALSGFGSEPLVSLNPVSLNFPQQVVGSITSQKVTLTNTGTAILIISKVSVSGQFTEHNNCSSTLVPGQSCAITVNFKPLSPGTFTGTVSISDNAPGSPQTVSLAGTGTAFSVSPPNLDFGDVVIGQTSAPQTETITNEAKSTQKIIGIHILKRNGSSEFTETSTCGSTLAAGASCNVSVAFSPIKLVSVDATLQVMGGDGVWEIGLGGTGIN